MFAVLVMTGKNMSITVFEEALLPGYIYPCSVEDIRLELHRLPEPDVQGLSAVGLVPSTRKDHSANARYFSEPRPVIYIFSYSETLTYKQPANVKRHQIEQWLAVELAYGMQIEPSGSRWLCRWNMEDLRYFILDHVLVHEVGHHVYYQQRKRQGLENRPSLTVREQFAEDYAIRHSQKFSGMR